MNTGTVCRIDGSPRVDPASAERAGWQCERCMRLNRRDAARCRGCGNPKPTVLATWWRYEIFWILAMIIAAGGIAALWFLPLVISAGAVATIVVAVLALVGMPFTRHIGRFATRSDAIILVGLCLWLMAQALPAYTGVTIDDEPNRVRGIAATLSVWVLFFFVPGPSGLLLTFAWSANVWLALSVLARWRWPQRMLPFAVLATVACTAGLGILVAGGVPEPGGQITDVGVGSWLWFAGTLIVLVGAAVPAVGRVAGGSSQPT